MVGFRTPSGGRDSYLGKGKCSTRTWAGEGKVDIVTRPISRMLPSPGHGLAAVDRRTAYWYEAVSALLCGGGSSNHFTFRPRQRTVDCNDAEHDHGQHFSKQHGGK